MHQTKFAVTALDESMNDNLSVPYGLIRTVRHYLEFVGVLSYIRGLKTKGVRLDLIVVALYTYTMHTSNSMNVYAEWLRNPAVRRQIEFSPKDEFSQKTLNRAIIILRENREGIIVRLWMGIKCGFFKLESDRQMTVKEALVKYRRRVDVEHLISSLKRITGIKPIRVWNKDSVDGSMTLAHPIGGGHRYGPPLHTSIEEPPKEVPEGTIEEDGMPAKKHKRSTES